MTEEAERRKKAYSEVRKTFDDLFHLVFFSQHFILLATLPFHWPIQLYFHFETDQMLNYGVRSYDVYIFLFAGRQTENISSIALFPFLDLSVLFFSFAFDSLWFPLIPFDWYDSFVSCTYLVKLFQTSPLFVILYILPCMVIIALFSKIIQFRTIQIKILLLTCTLKYQFSIWWECKRHISSTSCNRKETFQITAIYNHAFFPLYQHPIPNIINSIVILLF